MGAISHLDSIRRDVGYRRGLEVDVIEKKGGIIIVADNDAFTAERIVWGQCGSQFRRSTGRKLIEHMLMREAGDLMMFGCLRVDGSIIDRFSKVHNLSSVTALGEGNVFVECLSI